MAPARPQGLGQPGHRPRLHPHHEARLGSPHTGGEATGGQDTTGGLLLTQLGGNVSLNSLRTERGMEDDINTYSAVYSIVLCTVQYNDTTVQSIVRYSVVYSTE